MPVPKGDLLPFMKSIVYSSSQLSLDAMQCNLPEQLTIQNLITGLAEVHIDYSFAIVNLHGYFFKNPTKSMRHNLPRQTTLSIPNQYLSIQTHIHLIAQSPLQ